MKKIAVSLFLFWLISYAAYEQDGSLIIGRYCIRAPYVNIVEQEQAIEMWLDNLSVSPGITGFQQIGKRTFESCPRKERRLQR